MTTRRALALSFLDRYAALVIAIGSSMVIARLLTPTELGVYSVTMVLVSLTGSLRDLGAGQYLVQEKELTTDRLRVVWSVMLGMGWVLALVVLLAAHPVAAFYGHPEIVAIMVVVALGFVVNPLGAMTYAWLIREMRFDALVWMRLYSALTGAAVSIFLAWRGYGAISLAWGGVVSTLTNAAYSMRYRPAHFPWLPGRREWRRVLAFGSQISGTSIVRTLQASAPEMLLGKLQGMTAAGLFSRANGLAQMFNRLVMDATQAVAQPLFAKTFRETGALGDVFVRATAMVLGVGWPFFTCLAILAFPVVRLLYGNQWDDAVASVRWLCLATMTALPSALASTALVAAGRVDLVLRVTFFDAGCAVLAVAVGAVHHIEGAAIGLLASRLVTTLVWLGACRRELGFQLRHLWAAMLRSAIVAAVTGLGPLGVTLWFGWQSALTPIWFALAVSSAGALMILAILLSRHELSGELLRLAKARTGGP